MTPRPFQSGCARLRFCAVLAIVALLAGSSLAQAQGLKIVVIAGEDAVNIVQQKTAVAPIVEIRDRNDLPVAGVAVTFTMNGSGATFAGGLQSVSITSDAAGRAAATSIDPISSGRLQIQVRASYQNQVATAVIAQTIVMTAADAAQLARNAGGQSSAAGGAGGAGGGLSAVAIGAIAAGGGVGALVAVKAAGGDDTSTPSNPSNPGTPTTRTVTGPYSLTFGQIGTCGAGGTLTQTWPVTGTLTMVLNTAANGTVTGTLTDATTATTFTTRCSLTTSVVSIPVAATTANYPVTGTGSNITVRVTQTVNFGGTPSSGTVSFTGTQSGSTVTGTFGWSWAGVGAPSPVSTTVTLR